jgi:hypothetical protein
MKGAGVAVGVQSDPLLTFPHCNAGYPCDGFADAERAVAKRLPLLLALIRPEVGAEPSDG